MGRATHAGHAAHRALGVSTHALLLWGGRLSCLKVETSTLSRFQPTPSSYGEGDAARGAGVLRARIVSTHALLLWGGRRPRRPLGARRRGRFNPRPPLMGRATAPAA